MLTRTLLDLPAAADAGLILVLVVGGAVKGALGVGVSLVLVPLLAQFLALPVAVALLTLPMLAANLRQSLEAGGTSATLRRLAPILGTLVLGTVIGVHLLLNINPHALDIVVGTVFVLFAAMLGLMPRFRIGRGVELWASPLVGLVAGLLGGMSAMFGPPLIAYQVGLGVDPTTFVKHMAILALTATVALVLSLGGSGALTGPDLLVSAAAIVPIQIGMPLGRWLRGYVPPALFRVAVLCTLAWAGLDMLHRAFF
ncbi:MAG: TSUP family transporter [Stellaceae bacterium]